MSEDYWDKQKWREEIGEKVRQSASVPKIPTYKELETKLTETEEKYDALVVKIKLEGLDRANKQIVAEGDRYLQSYHHIMKGL